MGRALFLGVLLGMIVGCGQRQEPPAACTVTTISAPCDAFESLPTGDLACHLCTDAATEAPVDGCTLHLDVFKEPGASYTVLCVASCDECQA